MNFRSIIIAILAGFLGPAIIARAAPEIPALPYKLAITPEPKRAFHGDDAIEIHEVRGTAPTFRVGGTYRIIGHCHQTTLKNPQLYLGNTAEAGPAAITPVAGSSLSVSLAKPSTEFDITFTLLRPGLLHATIYDVEKRERGNNAYAGLYLGDVVFARE